MYTYAYMVGGPNKTGQSVVTWRTMRRFIYTPKDHSGFTIIEVMIVLVVTGALFVSAAILISGRQNQTAFDQAIHQIQADIQQTVNEVAVGYFPDTDFSCVASGSGPSLGSGGSGQGTNNGCVFLGKVMQFKVHDTDPEQYATYAIAGLQRAGNKEVQSLAEAMPKAVAPGTADLGTPGYPNITVIDKLQSGLTTNSNSPSVKGM
jgi:prepilin-type N-terminal cleavage/methylation domain-containing protein